MKKIDINEEWKRFVKRYLSTFQTQPSEAAYNEIKRIYYTGMLNGFKIALEIIKSQDLTETDIGFLLIKIHEQFYNFGREYII